MTCRQFVEFLLEYESGELIPAARAAFDEHLGVCPDCVRFLQQYRGTIAISRLATLEGDEPPEGVPEDLVRAVLAARRAM